LAIALHEPTFDSSDEAAVIEALRSTWVSTGGPFIDRFEKEIAEFVGAKYAIAVANGTLGLNLALEVMKRQSGVLGAFEVIVPTLSFAATFNSVLSTGGVPILMDAAIGSMQLDVANVECHIKSGYFFNTNEKLWVNKKSGLPLLAVMPAHIMGYGCNILALNDLCKDLQIGLIEDAAEALGVTLESGRHLGTIGNAGVFSFNGNKILTTGGGGMIVTNNKDFASRARHLSTTAKTDGLRFEHNELGYNFRLVNLLAALGCSQLAKLRERLESKQRVFDTYTRELEGYNQASIYTEQGFTSNHWIVNLVFNSFELREDALVTLLEQNIQARPLWTPGHRLGYIPNIRNSSYPNADRMWRQALSIPSSPHLADEVIQHICGIIRETTKEGRN